MGESADSGGGVGGDNVDRSNPAEMAAREKDFRESLGYTGDQGRDDFAADVNRGEFKYTQDLERQAAERQFSSPASQGLSDAAQRQADDERNAARIAAERAESDARLAAVRRQQAAAGQMSVDPATQLAVDRLAIADSGMITDADPIRPGPSRSLFSDKEMQNIGIAQRMLADEKTMNPYIFEKMYGYSPLSPVTTTIPLGATTATGATAANVLQGAPDPESAGGQPPANVLQGGPPDPESAGGQPPAIVDPNADIFAYSPIEQIAIDRRSVPDPLLTGQDGPTTPLSASGRAIDPSQDDDQQYDSRDDVKAYQAAMRQASGGNFIDKITGGKSDAEIAAINKAYVDRPYSALGISPGLALAATGDKALAGRLGGSIAMDASGNQVPLTGDMLADLNTRASGLGRFFNNNIMDSIADGGTAVVNNGRIEGAVSATGSYTGNNAFNPYGADDVDGGSDPFNQPPVDPCPPGYQLVNGVCQLIDDVTQDPAASGAAPGSGFQFSPSGGFPTSFSPMTQATQVGQVNPFVLRPNVPQGIQGLSPTGAALGRQV